MNKTLLVISEFLYNLIFILLLASFLTMAQKILPNDANSLGIILAICAVMQGVRGGININKIINSDL